MCTQRMDALRIFEYPHKCDTVYINLQACLYRCHSTVSEKNNFYLLVGFQSLNMNVQNHERKQLNNSKNTAFDKQKYRN